jgi:endonuclease/exonuclease/phosphatase family metal-dependent hydrolase
VWIITALILSLSLWVLNTSRVGRGPEGCTKDCSIWQSSDDTTIRVLTLNVFHDHPRFEHLPERLDLIAKEIMRLQADIVCLQEVTWTWKTGHASELLARQVGMNHVYQRANGNRWTILFEEGASILSRYPLENVSFVELEPQAGFFEHRIALHATAVTPWGEVGVIVTHLTNGRPITNYDQTVSLKRFVEQTQEPLKIVAGDFNTTPDSPQVRLLMRDWSDGYLLANPADQDFTCCIDDLTDGSEGAREKRIDYIFLVNEDSTQYTVRTARRAFTQPFQTEDGYLWVSDHVGLLIELQVEEE